MNELSYLAPVERPRMDTTQIESLCDDLGAYAAEDLLCRALEDLGHRLLQIQENAVRGPREELYKGLKGLAAVAEQIGMCGLAGVARDVMICVEFGDSVAEAATLARLARMGERSLSALWDLQDLSV